MENIFTKVIFIFILALSPCLAIAELDSSWTRNVTEKEIKDMRKMAVKGDPESSYRLSFLYGRHEHFSFIEYFFYLRLAAEQGDCRAVIEFNDLQRSETILRDFIVPEDFEQRARRCKSLAAKATDFAS